MPRRSRALLALALGAGIGVGAACRQDVAAVDLVLRAPLGVLGQATDVSLVVFDLDAVAATCGADGHVERPEQTEGVDTFTLEANGCAPGVAFCKDIELEEDGRTRMFSVVARNAAGVLAEGCVARAVDQDPLDVVLDMHRVTPPACCNDGELQAGEQCDSGIAATTTCLGAPGAACGGVTADAVCECDCLAHEIPLDRAEADAPAPPGSKRELGLAFCAGSDDLQGNLRAVFTDTAGATGGSDVAVRVLLSDLRPVAVPGLEPLARPLRLPLRCDDPGGAGAPRQQRGGALAAIAGSSRTAVAYLSDEQVANRFDPLLSLQTAVGCADDPPVRVGAGEASSDALDVAGGPPGRVLVVWAEGGRILGRLVDANGVLSPEDEPLVVASVGHAPRVAGSAAGFAVVYEGPGAGDGDGIFLRNVDSDGTLAPERRVNVPVDGLQSEPDVAVLEDGRALVVWTSGGDVYAQRFAAGGEAVAKDQDAPLHVGRDGDQVHPAAAAAVGAGSFFAVAWQDAGTRTIHARLLGGSTGFLYNSVTGQNDDFLASHPGLRSAGARPAVAIGGAGFVAVGWEDENAGVVVRRFPLPPDQE